jgi:hypothetical protein
MLHLRRHPPFRRIGKVAALEAARIYDSGEVAGSTFWQTGLLWVDLRLNSARGAV